MNVEKTTVPVKTEGWKTAFKPPFALFDELKTEFEQIWNKPFPFFFKPEGRFFHEEGRWMPRVDVFKKDTDLVVKADLPGMKREEIKVALENGFLVLKGERKSELEIKEEDLYRTERVYGMFSRRLPLGFEVDPTKVNATFTDGVLTVYLPLPIEVKPEPKEIPIN